MVSAEGHGHLELFVKGPEDQVPEGYLKINNFNKKMFYYPSGFYLFSRFKKS